MAIWSACALIVAASIVLAATNGWSDLRADGLRFEPARLALAVIAFVGFQIGAAAVWQSLVHRLGSPLALRPALIAWNTSLPARYAPTGLLMPVVRGAIAERYGVPQRVCFASVVYENVLSIVGAVVVAAGFVLGLPALRDEPARWLIVVVPVLSLAALHPAVFARAANWGLRRIGRSELPETIPMGSLIRFALLYAALFAVGGVSLFALVEALYPVGADDAFTVVGAFAAGCALSTVAFVLPGGIGAREAGIVLVLAPLIPTGIAIAVVVAFRLMQLAIELLLAAFAGAMASRDARGRRAAA